MRSDHPTDRVAGYVRDILRAADGTLLFDSGRQKNVVTDGGRRLLAGFLHGPATTVQSIFALRVGAGDPAWDAIATPPPLSSTTMLVDQHPYDHPTLIFEYLDPASDTVVAGPTNKLQIRAQLGPHMPSWPDANHTTGTLREYGLVAKLNGTDTLVNYRTHAAIAKDPTSTLERTIWLVF
jgi:hypothetical protein